MILKELVDIYSTRAKDMIVFDVKIEDMSREELMSIIVHLCDLKRCVKE